MALGPQAKNVVDLDVIIRVVMGLRGNMEGNLCPA